MGWADMLAALKIPYSSNEALALAKKLGSFIKDAAKSASHELAKERGSYPLQDPDEMYIQRHSSVTTIAPTGTISRIAGCSSGIEPYYALAWESNVLWDLDGARVKLIDAPSAVVKALFDNTGSYEEMQSILRDMASQPKVAHEILRKYTQDFSHLETAHEVDFVAHIEMQGAWQENTTNSVSKTINMSNEATVEEVSKAFRLAYFTHCKSTTIYRDGSKSIQVLQTGKPQEEKSVAPRPRILEGKSETILTGHGKGYINITFHEGAPFEVFANIGKQGGCEGAQLEAISRLCSLALRSGIPSSEIVDQLRDITCCPVWDDGYLIKSPADAVSYVLAKHSGYDMPRPHIGQPSSASFYKEGAQGECIKCGGTIIYRSSCWECSACGYSKCD